MRKRTFLQWIGRGAWLGLAVWLAVGSVALAQGTLGVTFDGLDTSAHPTMRALVTVTDENGIPVRGLDRGAFTIDEDGRGTVAPDRVEAVANQRAAVSVLIVIDLSSTMRGRPLQAAKDAIAKFLEALLNEANDPDRASFMGFTQGVKVTEATLADQGREMSFTNDRNKLLNLINAVDVDTGTSGTPLYDALFRAVKITAQQPGRRAIILMTDGADQASTMAASDPIDEANRQRIPIFPVGLSTGRLDTQYLERVAIRTGGQFQLAPTPEQLTQLLQNVLAQLKEQYVLTYGSRLQASDGQQHAVSVQVTAPRGSGSSKLTYQLGQAATAGPTQAAPTSGATSVPLAVAAPPSEGANLASFNPVLLAAIIAAALLFVLMVILIVAVISRRRSAPQPQPSVQPARAPGPARPNEPTLMPAVGSARPGMSGGPSSEAPTTAEPYPARGGNAPPPLPPVASPFRPTAPKMPAAVQPRQERTVSPTAPEMPSTLGASPGSRVPPGPGVSPGPGGTVIIQRTPKVKMIGMLVDKTNSRRFDLDKPATTLGRAPGNDIMIDHPTVSRQHAAIKIEGEEFKVYDLGSANGTFVNDARVRDPAALQDGMSVRFGEVDFVFKRVTLG